MTATSDRAASVRLLLPHPNQWTVSEAAEARACTGCTVRYEKGVRVVTVVYGCPAHTSSRARAVADGIGGWVVSDHHGWS